VFQKKHTFFIQHPLSKSLQIQKTSFFRNYPLFFHCSFDFFNTFTISTCQNKGSHQKKTHKIQDTPPFQYRLILKQPLLLTIIENLNFTTCKFIIQIFEIKPQYISKKKTNHLLQFFDNGRIYAWSKPETRDSLIRGISVFNQTKVKKE
jgi:hypothetical protein